MRSRVFEITEPRKIEEVGRDVELQEGDLLLRPIFTGICKSDINYFEGRRPQNVLDSVYPLIPLHEAATELFDADGLPTEKFFVPIPNMPCGQPNCPACQYGGRGDNYCPETRFASSNADGFARAVFPYGKQRVVPIPNGVPLDIASLTEPLSIAFHAAEEAKLERGMEVCVIGDGPIGLMQSLVSNYKGIDVQDNGLLGVGVDKIRLAKEYASVRHTMDLPTVFEGQYDVVFECVGNHGQGHVINQASRLLRPGGTVIVLGLSDEAQGIELRPLMKKGIILKGLMRSRAEHFTSALDMLVDGFYASQARKIIGGAYPVRNAQEINSGFANRYPVGRTLLD